MARTPGAKNKSKFIYVTLDTLNRYFKSQDIVLAISADYEPLFNPTRGQSVTVASHEISKPEISVTKPENHTISDEDEKPEPVAFVITKPQ